MTQYWWVNQTRSYDIERSKGLVAGEKNVEDERRTHWGRRNVKEMESGDFIVCYRSGIGIDRFAHVREGGQVDDIPWDLFCWDRVPGEDNRRFIKYLIGIDWIKKTKIEKIDNGKTIKASFKTKTLSLKLNETNSEVILEIDGNKMAKLITRMENHDLNIYEGDSKDRKAYIAKVDYSSDIKPIKKEFFWNDLKDIAGNQKGPIDLIRGQVRYAYAMNIEKKVFDKIVNLVETVNPGTAKELSLKFGYKYIIK
jgi:hypothetical protein